MESNPSVAQISGRGFLARQVAQLSALWQQCGPVGPSALSLCINPVNLDSPAAVRIQTFCPHLHSHQICDAIMSSAQHATELGKFLSRYYVAECKVSKDVFMDTLLAACDSAQACRAIVVLR